MRAAIILLLSALAAFGQTAFLYDIASFPQAVSSGTPCTGTNNVQWTPTNSIVTWQGVVGSGTGQYQYQFNTNPICDILSVQLNDLVDTITNLNTLTNMRYFESGASPSGTNRSFDLSNAYRMTNSSINYFTNLHFINITGCSNFIQANFSQNNLMTNLVGWMDSTNWSKGAVGPGAIGIILNNSGFGRNAQSNMIVLATNMIVTYGMTNFWINLVEQPLSCYTNMQTVALTYSAGYGSYVSVSDLITPVPNEFGNVLTNAQWSFPLGSPMLCNPSTTTVYIEWSSNGGGSWTPLRNLAFPGYDVTVTEGDLSAHGNPLLLKWYIIDSEVTEQSGDAISSDYTDPPP